MNHPRVAIVTVLVLICLYTDLLFRCRLERRPLPFSAPLSLLKICAVGRNSLVDCDTASLGQSSSEDHLVGLVVKASASRAEGPGFDFFGVESYQ